MRQAAMIAQEALEPHGAVMSVIMIKLTTHANETVYILKYLIQHFAVLEKLYFNDIFCLKWYSFEFVDEYTRKLQNRCLDTNENSLSGSFDSLSTAKHACSESNSCLGVFDRDCDSKSFELCKSIESKSKISDCIYYKKESRGMYST